MSEEGGGGGCSFTELETSGSSAGRGSMKCLDFHRARQLMLLSGLFLFIFAVAFLAVGGGSLALGLRSIPLPPYLPLSIFSLLLPPSFRRFLLCA